MNEFIIEPNNYLTENIRAFYNSDYVGGRDNWQRDGTVENIICTLKNDITPFDENALQKVVKHLSNILSNDLPEILQLTGLNNLTVCVIPRAKVNYEQNQLLFKSTVSDVVDQLGGFSNGTDFIIRCIDTRTTHRNRVGHGGNGDLPYPGITTTTCTISNYVRGKGILLIDDLYTGAVNIDEDAIQALLTNGAKSVIFYAVGRTVYNRQ